MAKYKEAGGITKIDTSKIKIDLNLHAEKKTNKDKEKKK